MKQSKRVKLKAAEYLVSHPDAQPPQGSNLEALYHERLCTNQLESHLWHPQVNITETAPPRMAFDG